MECDNVRSMAYVKAGGDIYERHKGRKDPSCQCREVRDK